MTKRDTIIYESNYADAVKRGLGDAEARQVAWAAVNDEDAACEVEEWASEDD